MANENTETGMQIRLEKPKRARIALALPDFVKLAARRKGFEIFSDPTDVAGFKWKLKAKCLDDGDDAFLYLYLTAHPPQHYKGDFKFDADISFRLLNTLSLSKEIRKEMMDVEIKKGWNYWFDDGRAYTVYDGKGYAGTEFTKIVKLRNPKNGFLHEDGSVHVEVDFIVKTATFDHLLLDKDDDDDHDDADNGEHMESRATKRSNNSRT